MRVLQVLCAALLLAAPLGAAKAAEIKVVSAGAMRAVLQELIPQFEKSSGHKVKVEYATAGGVEQKVVDDKEEIDVAIMNKPRMDGLARKAKVVGGTAVAVAKAQIGLAVKKGAPKPDIGSVDAFKQALLKAKSIAYTDPASGGTSGIHLAQVMEKLGIAAEVKPKTKLISATAAQGSPSVGDAVEKGDAEIGLQPISELMEVKGIDVVGPIPADLQTPELTYSAAAPTFADQPIAAKAFIDFINSPAVAAVYKAKGLEYVPPPPPQ